MKLSLMLSIILVSLGAHAMPAGLYCRGRGNIPNGAFIQPAGYRKMLVNGELWKNWSVVFNATLQPGVYFGYIWEPGRNPNDSGDLSYALKCTDPNAASKQNSRSYYPDSF